MLKGIPELISPDLLYILSSMGHGDTIVIADEYYPAVSKTESKRVIYTKGLDTTTVIDAITEIFPLDTDFSDEPVMYMVSDDFVDGDSKLEVHEIVSNKLVSKGIDESKIKPIKRNEFYEIARNAYATISTSEQAAYGCFILQKGIK